MSSSLALKYSHNVIEHLGIKLYQNKPTNVIAELVSNSWDAYAQNVWINNETVRVDEKKFISFADDGWGMSYDELKFKGTSKNCS